MLSESLWKIVSFVLAIVLMIVFPIMHLYNKQDELVYHRVTDDVNEFVNTIKYTGYLDENMWNTFVNKVNSYGYAFDISISHKEGEDVPVYENPDDLSSFEGQTKRVYYENSHYDIMKVVFPDDVSVDSSKRIYQMNAGDFIVVDVKASQNSRADMLRNSFLNADIKNNFNVRFSGMIVN